MRHELHPSTTISTPIWDPVVTDSDLTEAAMETPTISAWLNALASLGEATMSDSRDQQLYAQAPDALRQRSIEPTSEAIDRWVEERRVDLA